MSGYWLGWTSVLIGVVALGDLVFAAAVQHTRRRRDRETRQVRDALQTADGTLNARGIAEAADVPTKRLMPILHELVHDQDVITGWAPISGGVTQRVYRWRGAR